MPWWRRWRERPCASALGLRVLPEIERQELLTQWNASERDYPTGELIHELFEAQVAHTPNAVAVVYEGESLHYAALNARANQLARHLRTLGVGPDAIVGVCLERSVDMVVALLAVAQGRRSLPAAGSAVPARTPAVPAARCAGEVLLTHRVLDEQREQIARHSEQNPEAVACARNLAYVIYTSGSTGQPKGAMNEHAAVVNRLRWMQEAYALDDTDAVLQKTPYKFDVSVWEFSGRC